MPITVKTFATLGEAASAISADRGARFLAGGTLVMRAVNEGDLAIQTIVRASDRAAGQIRSAGARIEIGAGVTVAAILAHRELAFLHGAARVVGGPAVRSAATVGGNLFAPTPYGDLATALLALDGTVRMGGASGETPLEEFFAARERRSLRGLVAGIAVTRPASAEAFRFRKVSLVKPKGISVLTIAAHLPLVSGRVAGARVAYGAMGPTPMRAKAVELALEGRTLDEAGIGAAIAVAADGVQPSDDALASAWYRREILPVYLKRLLLGLPA